MRVGRSRFVTDEPRSTLTVVAFAAAAVWFGYSLYRAFVHLQAWAPGRMTNHSVRLQDDANGFWLAVAWQASMLVLCALGGLWVWAADRDLIQMTSRKPRRHADRAGPA
jgi:hypothetical protein